MSALKSSKQRMRTITWHFMFGIIVCIDVKNLFSKQFQWIYMYCTNIIFLVYNGISTYVEEEKEPTGLRVVRWVG